MEDSRERTFEDGTGNLYKEIWPIRSNGDPRSDGEYAYALKTNEHNNPSFEIIRSFGDAMGSATADERMQIVQEWMDVEEVLAYAVVDRTIRNDDGVFTGTVSGEEAAHWVVAVKVTFLLKRVIRTIFTGMRTRQRKRCILFLGTLIMPSKSSRTKEIQLFR